MPRRPTERTALRWLLALLLVAVAVAIIVAEPFPKGRVLLSFTHRHGLDAGDLPAIALLLVAAWLLRRC